MSKKQAYDVKLQRNLQIMKQADNFAYTKHMLVWDSFKCHISDNAKDRLKHCNTVMSVIPGGCRKIWSPLMFPFTCHSRNIFVKNMMTGFIKVCLNILLEVT